MMDRVQVVLVRPDDGANVGAVCRAMKTMGVQRLAVIRGRSIDIDRVQTVAVHAYDVFESSVQAESLDQVLEDSVIAAGVTRRRGRFRKYVSFTPEQFAHHISRTSEGTISLVFGNEEHGLTDGELKVCDTAIHIPSSKLFPSLNLSHAVQIILYALRSAGIDGSLYQPVTRKELAYLTDHITGCLERIGFFTLTGKEEMNRFLRDILSRSSLCSEEAERVKNVFTKIERLKLHRPGLDKEEGNTV